MNSNKPACEIDGAGTDQIHQAPGDMNAHGPEHRRELLFGEAIPRKPDLLVMIPTFGPRQLAEIFRKASRHGLQRKILRERDETRHMLAGSGDQLEGHGRMLLRETVHRVHVEDTQPRPGHRHAVNNVPLGAKGRWNAEGIALTIEHPQDLLPPLGIHPTELHPPRFEDVEMVTGVPLHEDDLARPEGLRVAAGGEGLQSVRTETSKIGDGLQEGDDRIRGVHNCARLPPSSRLSSHWRAGPSAQPAEQVSDLSVEAGKLP